MPQFYFHYSSREAAQQIIAQGKLTPRQQGQRLWLSADFYNQGADAAKNLVISGKPIEVVCIIPAVDIDGKIELSDRGEVDPAPWDVERNKTGGGSSYYTYDEISVRHAIWLELASP